VQVNIVMEPFVVESFLSDLECKEFIDYAQGQGVDDAKVGFPDGQLMVKGIRDNQRLQINNPKIGGPLFARAKGLLPESVNNRMLYGFHDSIRFYKYDAEQRFKMHKDGHKNIDDKISELTFLIYLNSDFEGGETKFRDYGVVEPSRGKALIFPHGLWHEGMKVKSGYKYVMRFDVLYS